MERLKISCQKHKIGGLLLSARCMANCMKTCSFLDAHKKFTTTMHVVEDLSKKLMVKTDLLKIHTL